MLTLKERLQDWVDADVAAYYLAELLGFVPSWPGTWDSGIKHIFWSTNPVGDHVYRILFQLHQLGMLERSDDGYRWNKDWIL